MKRLSFVALLFGSLFSWLSCSQKKMPEGELVRVEFTRSGTMAGYEYEGRVSQDSTGAFVLRAMKKYYGPLFEKKLDKEAMKHFRQIIEEEKMYQYKEAYLPRMEVLDGWGWSFNAKFSDGSSIYSHGSNATPNGDGLGRIQGYMEELIADGVQIEFPEEDDITAE